MMLLVALSFPSCAFRAFRHNLRSDSHLVFVVQKNLFPFLCSDLDSRLMNGEVSSGSSSSSKVERQLEPWDGGCSGDELEFTTEINGGEIQLI